MRHDPIAKLMEDHQVFLRTAASFREQLWGPAGGDAVPSLAPRHIAEFAGFLRHDVDRVHGQQEERGLFPALAKYIPVEGGPIGVMLGEHEALRELQHALERGGRKLESDPAAEEAKRSVGAASRQVDELLSAHVSKEDAVLFPMAYQVLSGRELEEIDQVFEEVAAAAGCRAP